MESPTKFYGVRPLITEETYRHYPQLTVRRINRVTVRGSTPQTTLCEVQLPSDLKEGETQPLFIEVIAAFHLENNQRTLRLFKQIQAIEPNETVAKIHRDRLSEKLRDKMFRMIVCVPRVLGGFLHGIPS